MVKPEEHKIKWRKLKNTICITIKCVQNNTNENKTSNFDTKIKVGAIRYQRTVQKVLVTLFIFKEDNTNDSF